MDFSSNENNNKVINSKMFYSFQKEMVESLGVLSMGIQIIILKLIAFYNILIFNPCR